MLHLWCKGAALLLALLFESLYSGFSVGHCYDTVGIPMLYCRYTYAVLSVSLCGTFGTRMLCFSGTVFSICLQAISR